MSLLLLKKQKGSTLIEIIGALAITAGLILAIASSDNDKFNSIKEQNAANLQGRFAIAASLFVRSNYAAVLAGSTATTPYKITTTQLMPTYTPGQAFLDGVNTYKQQACVLILQPSPNQLVGLLVTEAGSAIPDKSLSYIASQTGPSGGYIDSTLPLTAKGVHGGWSIPLASYIGPTCSGTTTTSGHLANAIFFDNNTVIKNFAYRNQVGGHSEANTFSTPIIFTPSASVSSGASCTSYAFGATASDSTGALFSCKGSPLAWAPAGTIASGEWSDPVSAVSALGTCNAGNAGYTKATADGFGLYSAYTCNGTSWNPAFADNYGEYPAAYITKRDATAATIQQMQSNWSVDSFCNKDSFYDYGGGILWGAGKNGAQSVCSKHAASDVHTYARRSGTYAFGDPVGSLAALNAITSDPVGFVRIPLDVKYPYMWNGSSWVVLDIEGFTVNGGTNIKNIVTATCAGASCVTTATCAAPYANISQGICSGDSQGLGSLSGSAWVCTANANASAGAMSTAYCN